MQFDLVSAISLAEWPPRFSKRTAAPGSFDAVGARLRIVGRVRAQEALGRRPGQQVGFLVERGDQPGDALVPQDRGKLGTADSQFTDRAVEIHGSDVSVVAFAAHQIADRDGLAVGFDNSGLNDQAAGEVLLAGDLEALAGIAVGIGRRNIASEGLGYRCC
jgi:hypothetical protein